MLLDEATSALDSKAEKLVQEALDTMLKSMNGSVISIAHRLTTIKNCDNIVVIKEGEMVEQGKHEELLSIEIKKKKDDGKEDTYQGIYRDLWETQMSDKDKDKNNDKDKVGVQRTRGFWQQLPAFCIVLVARTLRCPASVKKRLAPDRGSQRRRNM